MMSTREVVKIKAKKINDLLQTETKQFSIDPSLTNLSVLRDLLRRAFSLTSLEFVVSYLEVTRGISDVARYTPLLSEWDLNKALEQASDPYLFLKINVEPLIQDEWDAIDNEDNCAGESLLKHATVSWPNLAIGAILQKPLFNNGSNNFVTNISQRFLPLSSSNNVVKASVAKDLIVNDVKFRSFLDGDGRLIHEKEFRLAVYQNGLEASLRAVVWRHLLNVYPKKDDVGMTGQERILYTKRLAEKYYAMKTAWLEKFKTGRIGETLRTIANAVRKDVLRTDRTHEFYAGDDDKNKNVLALFYLLVTYGLTHPETGYCQGMSDLASPILVVMKDEAQAYISFCALMRRMKRNFASDGCSMITKFCHLKQLLQHYDSTFHEYLREMCADDLLFCYRWLLLDLKREFSFNDALCLMEVMWASLPPDPPNDESETNLFDVDITVNSYYDMSQLNEGRHHDDDDDDDDEDEVWNEIESKDFPQIFQKRIKSLSTSTDVDSRNYNSHQMAALINSLHLNKESTFANSQQLFSSTMDDMLAAKMKLTNLKLDDIGTHIERKRRYTIDEHLFRRPNLKLPSTEFSVSDSNSSCLKNSPVPVAEEAYSSPRHEHSLTLTEINDICLIRHATYDDTPSTNSKTAYHLPSSISAPTLHDELLNCIDEGDGNGTITDRDKPKSFDLNEASSACLLPSPNHFGDGNPFMIFVCLTLLLQHRDIIIRNRMDFNDIAVYLDKLVRKHKVHRVLKRARIYYADYLKSKWFKEDEEALN